LRVLLGRAAVRRLSLSTIRFGSFRASSAGTRSMGRRQPTARHSVAACA